MKSTTVKRIICLILITIIPFVMMVSLGFLSPKVFDETYLGELKDKTDKLYSLKENKIVIIGGSSVPFGVNTTLLEEMLGMKVVNYGLYADIGTKAMLDLSKGAIKEGDIVVLAPELDKQTYSLYFGAKSMWQACDSDMSILFKMKANYGEMFGSYFDYLVTKFKYIFAGEKPVLNGIYQKSSFDDNGYISYDRPYNIMSGMYDTSHIIYFDKNIISNDFIEYVNEYISYVEKKGGTVYFSFSPMNNDALDPNATLDGLIEFTNYIKESFNCEVISNPNNMIYRSGYFYDSNFHVNSSGAILHTTQLAKDLAEVLDITLQNIPEKPEMPKVPEKPEEEEKYDYDSNEEYFTFELIGEKYRITGTTEKAKDQKEITLPRGYNGKRVAYLGSKAFDGLNNLEIINIPDTIDQINDEAFSGAPKLKIINIEDTDPNNITVDNISLELTKGMASGAKFYVDKDSYYDFENNYFWGPYASFIKAR